MFHDLFHGKSVAGVVDDPGQFLHELWNEVRSKIGSGQLRRVQVRGFEGGVESEDLLDQVGHLGSFHHLLIVPLDFFP